MENEYITLKISDILEIIRALKKPDRFFTTAVLGLIGGYSKNCYNNELEEYLFNKLKKNTSFKTEEKIEFKPAHSVVKYDRNHEVLGIYNSMAECLRTDGLRYDVDPLAKEIYQCFYTGRLCSNGCYYEPYSNEGISYSKPLDNLDEDLKN